MSQRPIYVTPCEPGGILCCPSCSSYLHDPIETQCHHYFCNECLMKNSPSDSTYVCPTCSASAPKTSLQPPSSAILQPLSAVHVYCLNYPVCQWDGTQRSLSDHISNCQIGVPELEAFVKTSYEDVGVTCEVELRQIIAEIYSEPTPDEDAQIELNTLEATLSTNVRLQNRINSMNSPQAPDLESLQKQLDTLLAGEKFASLADLNSKIRILKRSAKLPTAKPELQARLETYEKAAALWKEIETLSGKPSLSSPSATTSPHPVASPSSVAPSSSTADHGSVRISSITGSSQIDSVTPPSMGNDPNDESCRADPVQDLLDLLENLEKMPPCAEYYLLKLHYILKISLSKDIFADGDVRILTSLHKSLTDILPVEPQFLSESQRTSLVTVGSSIQARQFQSATNLIQKIVDDVCPLNVQDALRLSRATKTASSSIAGQDIVLLIGRTGSGKSTLVLHMAGAKFKKVHVKDLEHLQPMLMPNSNSALRTFKTNPRPVSETLFINSIAIKHNGRIYYITDTPGFGDTSRCEVDIANGKGLVDAIRCAKSVKILLLVSTETLSEKMVNLRQLLGTLALMIPSFKQYTSSIGVLFNRVTEANKSTIRPKLIALKEELIKEGTFTSPFSDFLDMMLDQTEDGIPVADVQNTDPKVLFKLIDSLEPITEPAEVFENYVAPSSIDRLNSQLRQHRVSVIHALKRRDYTLLKWKLDELRDFSKEFSGVVAIEGTYKVCLDEVYKHLKLIYTKSDEVFNAHLKRNILTKDCVDDILAHIEQLAEFEAKIGLEEDGGHLVATMQYSKILQQTLDGSVCELAGNIEQVLSNNDPYNDQVLENLMKLDQICRVYSSPSASVWRATAFSAVDKCLETRVLNLFKQLEARNPDLDAVTTEMERLAALAIVVPADLAISHLLDDLKEAASNYFRLIVTHSSECFNGPVFQVTEAQVRATVQLCESLDGFAGSSMINRLSHHIDPDLIKQALRSLVDRSEDYFVRCCKNVTEAVTMIMEQFEAGSEDHQSFSALKDCFIHLDMIQMIPNLKIHPNAWESHQTVLRTTAKFLKTAQDRAVQLINSCFNQDNKEDLASSTRGLFLAINDSTDRSSIDLLRKLIDVLSQAEWVDPYLNQATFQIDGRARVLGQVSTTLVRYCNRLYSYMSKCSDFRLENHSQLSDAIWMISRVNAVSALADEIPGLKEQVNKINEWFADMIAESLPRIEQLIQTDRVDVLNKQIQFIESSISEFEQIRQTTHPAVKILIEHQNRYRYVSEVESDIQKLKDSLRQVASALDKLETEKEKRIKPLQEIGTTFQALHDNLVLSKSNERPQREAAFARYKNQVGFSNLNEILAEQAKLVEEFANASRKYEDIEAVQTSQLEDLQNLVKKHAQLVKDDPTSVEATDFLKSLPSERFDFDTQSLLPFTSISSLKAYLAERIQEKERLQSDGFSQAFAPVDVAKIAQSFSYLQCFFGDNVHPFDGLKQIVIIKEQLNSFMKSYLALLTEKLGVYFSRCTNRADTSSFEARKSAAVDLSHLIEELSLMAEYPQLHHLNVDQELNHWATKLNNEHNSLLKEMERESNLPHSKTLRVLIEIIHALSEVDNVIPNRISISFAKTYSDLTQQNRDLTNKTIQQATDHIRRYEFQYTASLLDSLSTHPHNLKTAQTALAQIMHQTLRRLEKEIKGKISAWDNTESISPVPKLSDYYEALFELTSNEILKPILPEKNYEKYAEDLKYTLEEKIKEFINATKITIENRNFEAAQKEITKLKAIVSTLAPHIGDLNSELTPLTECVTHTLNDVVRNFREIPVSEWVYNSPKDEFLRLKDFPKHQAALTRVILETTSGLLNFAAQANPEYRVYEFTYTPNSSLVKELVNRGVGISTCPLPAFVVVHQPDSTNPQFYFVQDPYTQFSTLQPIKCTEECANLLKKLKEGPLDNNQLLTIKKFVKFQPALLRNKILNDIKRTIPYLPDEHAKALDSRTKQAEEQMDESINETLEDVKSSIESADIEVLKSQLSNLQSEGLHKNRKKVQNDILEYVNSLARSIRANIQQFLEALSLISQSEPQLPILELDQYELLFKFDKMNVSEITKVIDSVRPLASKAINSVVDGFVRKPVKIPFIAACMTPLQYIYPLKDSSLFSESLKIHSEDIEAAVFALAGLIQEQEKKFKHCMELLQTETRSFKPEIFQSIIQEKVQWSYCIQLIDNFIPSCKLSSDHPLTKAANDWTSWRNALHLSSNTIESIVKDVQTTINNMDSKNQRNPAQIEKLLSSLISKIVALIKLGPIMSSPEFQTANSVSVSDFASPIILSLQLHYDRVRDRCMECTKSASPSQATADWLVYDYLELKEICTNTNLEQAASICKGEFNLFQFAKRLCEEIEDSIDKQIARQQASVDLNEKDLDVLLEKMVDSLIDLMKISNRYPFKAPITHGVINNLLNSFDNKRIPNSVTALRQRLMKTSTGGSIVQTFSTFDKERTLEFNEKTKAQDLETTLSKLDGSDMSDLGSRSKVVENLRRRYRKWEEKYQSYLKEYANESLDFDSLVKDIKSSAAPAISTAESSMFAKVTEMVKDALRQPKNRGWKPKVYTDTIPELIAGLSALWTLQTSSHYFEAKRNQADLGGRRPEDYMLKPKPVQVIGILRLFGADSSEGILNHLIEIKTGEGKSVTLALAAAALALLGFDVNIACYSSFLTARDKNSFEKFFQVLGIDNHVTYGTFSELCEEVINSRGSIRARVHNVLVGKPVNEGITINNGSTRKKVLLIDEVDVFFSKNFYGMLYIPSTSLQDPTISALARAIWNCRQSTGKVRFTQVSALPEYQAVLTKFNPIKDLVVEAIKEMTQDIKEYNTPPAVVKEDKLGYTEIDGSISFSVRYGYKTMWSYFAHHQQGTISADSLQRNISLNFHCGHFSYAEIPRLYDHIMGVTGTLRDLSDAEKAIVKEYDIHKFTYSPSMYGDSRFKWFPNKDTTIIFKKPNDTDATHLDEYFQALHKLIKDEIEENPAMKKQPGAVLVFFEDDKTLEAFKNSSFGKEFPNIRILDATQDSATKEAWVRESTTSGSISILNRNMGRGTDFSCNDPIVLAGGGVLVIQTFLSKEKSEETQIKGRTARQGQEGKYHLLLRSSQLEEVGVPPEDIEAMSTNGIDYKLLDQRRNQFFKAEYDNNAKYVTHSKSEHTRALKLLQLLEKQKIPEIKQFLVSQNQTTLTQDGSSRTLVIMDATGSMSGLLRAAQNTVSVMFERVCQILKDNGYPANSFELQFAVYRNYNAPDSSLLQHSSWESRSDNLQKFMTSVRACYGCGPEAVEIGLQHANRMAQLPEGISQVLLIGDAPPNSPDQVIALRQREKGEKYWQKYPNFAQPTTTDAELAKLISLGVPVHAFPVAQWAIPSFEVIASKTSGHCEFLDVNSADGPERLTNFVSQRLLASSVPADKAEKLLKDYKDRYMRSYQ